MKENYLELKGITKKFPDPKSGEVTAVDNLDLKIREGEFVVIVGPSGCGKTTVLRMIAGFEMPSRGKIFLNDKDITYASANKRGTAMVFQSYALFPHMTIFENVAFGLKLRKFSKKEIVTKVEETLSAVGLDGYSHRSPSKLSGGQQQRVALARALVLNPAVLLCDEPLSNLDAGFRIQMRTEIKRLQRKFNITTVYVTHDQDEAMILADRLILMKSGKPEQIGKPVDLYNFPRNRFVAQFMGRVNYLPGVIDSVSGNEILASVYGSKIKIQSSDGLKKGEKVSIVARPENLTVVHPEKSAGLNGAVINRSYHGNKCSYVVDVDGNELSIDVPGASTLEFKRGDKVGIILGKDLWVGLV